MTTATATKSVFYVVPVVGDGWGFTLYTDKQVSMEKLDAVLADNGFDANTCGSYDLCETYEDLEALVADEDLTDAQTTALKDSGIATDFAPNGKEGVPFNTVLACWKVAYDFTSAK